MPYLLNIFIYGTDILRIDNLYNEYINPMYNIEKILIDNKKVTNDNILSYIFKIKVIDSQSVFINADTMKSLRIRGINSLYDIIMNTVSIITPVGKYVILFNRYMDSNIQSRYIGEYNTVSNVSLFQSFNPSGSDAYYLPKITVNYLNTKYNTNIEQDLYNNIKNGNINAYSYNPNLFIYTLENTNDTIEEQYHKSSIIDSTNIIENRKLEQSIGLFFSDHIILFWIFMVFIICILCISILKLFKIKL